MDGMTERQIVSERLASRVLSCGAEDGIPVIFAHGNLSAAPWWMQTMMRLPEGFRAIAPDLRGYGKANRAAQVDATRGMKDFSDDLAALMARMEIERAHFVGHSLGGGVLWQMLADYPEAVLSLTQICPASPYGFGATRADGVSCFVDGAGSGAAAVNPQFAALLASGARGDDSALHPRSVLNAFVWKPPFVPQQIDMLLDAALSQHCGEQDYPGDVVASDNWPMAAPGKFGPINALSPIYQSNPLGFVQHPHAPILWVRGADDQIVSDASLFDLGTLGQAGIVPGWPGLDIFPPQPMVSQIESALQAYQAAGGTVLREVIAHCGHSPYLEKPSVFDAAFHPFLSQADAKAR